MDLKLKGKKAFISGSTQGIGFAIAQQLLNEDVEVIINGRQEEKTKQAVDRLKKQYPDGKIGSIVCDFGNRKEVNRLLEKLDSIDILINNVGVFELKDFDRITDEDWYRIFELNVMSSVRLSRKVLPELLMKKWGRIIFISSESGVNVPEDMIHYGMTKTAMLSISNGLSKLTKGTEVTVNTVLGGPTYTDGVAATVEQLANSQQVSVDEMKGAIIRKTSPFSLIKRFLEPGEIASLTVYLSSPLSIATNGACLRADGGVLQTI